MPNKHIVNQQINYQHVIFLVVFVIGCFLLYRIVCSVRGQCTALKSEFEAFKLTCDQNKYQNNIPISVFEKSTMIQDDDNISINSNEIDIILRKINSSNDECSSTDGKIVELNGDEEAEVEVEVESEVKTIVESDPTEFVEDSTEYTEDILSKKGLNELKNILKTQNKQTKGNKPELIKKILE